MIVKYLCETNDRDEAMQEIMDSVAIGRIEDRGVELVSVN